MIELSIIIVNFNGSGFIESCLESIMKHPGDDVNLEVIIADNASNDGSAEYLRDFCSGHKRFYLMEMGSNTGFGRASNKGAESAKGKFLLFLNPDCKITGGDIGSLLKFYKDSDNPGIIGAKIIGESDGVHLSPDYFERLIS